MSDDWVISMLDVDEAHPVTFRYDVGDAEPPSHALATVLATATGGRPTEMDPLGHHVDLDAMNRLLDSTEGGDAFSGTFVLDAGCLVLVVRRSEIVGVASRDAMDWAPAGD